MAFSSQIVQKYRFLGFGTSWILPKPSKTFRNHLGRPEISPNVAKSTFLSCIDETYSWFRAFWSQSSRALHKNIEFFVFFPFWTSRNFTKSLKIDISSVHWQKVLTISGFFGRKLVVHWRNVVKILQKHQFLCVAPTTTFQTPSFSWKSTFFPGIDETYSWFWVFLSKIDETWSWLCVF